MPQCMLDSDPRDLCRRFLLMPFQFGLRLTMFLFGFLYIHEKGCWACPGNAAPVNNRADGRGTLGGDAEYIAPSMPCDHSLQMIVCNHVSLFDPMYIFYKFLPCAAGK